MLSNAPHHNQRLFSDYFLDHKLPEEWNSLWEDASLAMEQIQQLAHTFLPIAKNANEAQTEYSWIRPILQILGHVFEVQSSLKTPDGVQRPDYFFYLNNTALEINKGKILTDNDLKQGAYAVGDAKSWDRSLDQTIKGNSKGNTPFTNKNPSYQIFFYMLHSGLPWGLLTNGRSWRLYQIQTAHKLEVYYEVDLPALLETKDVRQFLYFYTFFRQTAFEQGSLSLEHILTASTEYASSVSEDLRQQVYDALRYIAQGFFDYSGNNLAATPETCKLIYDSSLTLLYRLLFIFYAEARDLLPLQTNLKYQRMYSLFSIKHEIVTNLSEALHPLLLEAVKDKQSDAERIQAVLAINVLDPSMGSGHFPVEVMEYIARFLVEQGVQSEETSEADIMYWKRRVAQQCIYGVDLNPLAVELAKLSLWLATAAKDRPLSFLDHHLRVGNALIGSWLSEITTYQHPRAKQAHKRINEVEEKEKDAGQLSLLSDDDFQQRTSIALNSIAIIEHNPGVTIADVKVQEAAYEELRKRFSEKYLRLANLGTAMYYDLGIDTKLWQTLADHALGKTIIQTPQLEKIVSQVMDIAKKKGFFHWDLEFPGIFFDSQGHPLGNRAGFDVVIGNPPYVRQEQLGPDKAYFREHYNVYHGVADLFVYFFAQGLNLLRKDGRLVYISSNAWLRANYATPLRQHLRTQTTVETIVDLGDNRVFVDAPDMTPAIQIVCKTSPTNGYTAKVTTFARGESISSFRNQLDDKLFPLSIHDQPDTGWQMIGDISRSLFAKIMAAGKPLGEFVQGCIYRGVLTGLNEAFIIDQTTRDRLVQEDPSCAAIIRPMLRGEDLRPWYQENEGRWLIFTRRGIDINAYPSVLSHLQQFREQLEPRPSNWNDEHTWPGRKPGPYQWYEIQDSVDYYNAFEQPKILWPDITKKPRFSWDESGVYFGNTGYCIPAKSQELLGIMASRIHWYILSEIAQPFGERAGTLRYRLIRQYMERLPIPSMTDTQRETIGTLARQLTKVAQQRYEVRRKTTYRIQSDLGVAQGKLNQRLTTWWILSFKEFREEIVKVFKHDIPLKEREDWELWLEERRTEIEHFTNEIITLETQLNGAVYEAFGLDNDEIVLIEQETKYQYGEW